MLRSTSRSSRALLSFGILRLCWFWCIPTFCFLKIRVLCDFTRGQVLKCYPNSGGLKFLHLEGRQVQAVLFGPKCGGTALLRNVVNVTSPNGVTSQCLWEPQISHSASFLYSFHRSEWLCTSSVLSVYCKLISRLLLSAVDTLWIGIQQTNE